MSISPCAPSSPHSSRSRSKSSGRAHSGPHTWALLKWTKAQAQGTSNCCCSPCTGMQRQMQKHDHGKLCGALMLGEAPALHVTAAQLGRTHLCAEVAVVHILALLVPHGPPALGQADAQSSQVWAPIRSCCKHRRCCCCCSGLGLLLGRV